MEKDMSKPDIENVLRIVRMKQEAVELYEEIEKEVSKIKSEFGAVRFDYDLEEFLDEMGGEYEAVETLTQNGRYLKFEITDNAAKIAEGQSVFAKAYVKPLVWESRSLKRCPDSLK
jgi:hypothetical protein